MLALTYQTLKRSRDPEHTPFGRRVIYLAYASTCRDQSAHVQLHPFQRHDGFPRFKNGSRDPDNAHFGVVCHSKLWPSYVLNFKSLGSPVSEV